MCTPWKSCFSSCRLSLDDHELASSQVSVRKSMAFDKKKDNRINIIQNNNLSWSSKKCHKMRQPNTPMDNDKEGVLVGNRVDHSSWALSNEDYIVFCFREDGTFDVVKDYKGVNYEIQKGVDGKHKHSRPVNRKLEFGEDTEQVSDQIIHEKRSNTNQRDTDQRDHDCITPSKEDVEKESIYLSKNQQRDRSIKRACQIEEVEDGRTVSAESRDSNQSECSTGSFAFPVLGWEWIGSPLQMPNSEDVHLRKQKVRSLRFQCCRF